MRTSDTARNPNADSVSNTPKRPRLQRSLSGKHSDPERPDLISRPFQQPGYGWELREMDHRTPPRCCVAVLPLTCGPVKWTGLDCREWLRSKGEGSDRGVLLLTCGIVLAENVVTWWFSETVSTGFNVLLLLLLVIVVWVERLEADELGISLHGTGVSLVAAGLMSFHVLTIVSCWLSLAPLHFRMCIRPGIRRNSWGHLRG